MRLRIAVLTMFAILVTGALVALLPSQSASAQIGGTAGANCQRLCAEEAPECFLINYRAADSEGSLTAMHSLFSQSGPFNVTSDEIATAFDMEGYELMDTRGSITVDHKGRFSNSGETRELIFVENLVSYEFVAGISFPQTFSGQLWKSGGDLMFDFPVEENSFQIGFSNSIVDNRFGGPVRRVVSTADSGIIGLDNGCIQVPYKTSLLENIQERAAGTAALLGTDLVVELVEAMTQEDFGSDYTCNPPVHPECPGYPPPF